jgi:hypothetical protein
MMVATGVNVAVGVMVAVGGPGVFVEVGVFEGVKVGEEVAVEVGVRLGVLDAVAVGGLFPELESAAGTVGSAVSVGDGLGLGVCVAVNVGLAVGVTTVGDATESSVGVAPQAAPLPSISSKQHIANNTLPADNPPRPNTIRNLGSLRF